MPGNIVFLFALLVLMNPQKTILIVDDNSILRRQLVRLARSVISDSHILESESYDDAIELINRNSCEINILVCDLFLSSNESDITNKNYIPEGIQLAQDFKNKKPQSLGIIVTSNISSFVSHHQLIDYRDSGIYILDRAVTPYEKFSNLFKYQLLSHSVNENINPCYSYWIFVDSGDNNLANDILEWEENFAKPEAFILIVKPHDERIFHLRENGVLSDIEKYPILLVGDSPEMLENIKIGSRTLNLIQENGGLANFLYLTHFEICKTKICEIRKLMESSCYWDQLERDDITGFSHETGEIELISYLEIESSRDSRSQGLIGKNIEIEEKNIPNQRDLIPVKQERTANQTAHYTRIDFPVECPLNHKVELKIQLVIQSSQETRALEKIRIEKDTEVEIAILDIQITAENFTLNERKKQLKVPAHLCSETIMFDLIPVETGEQIIEIEFFHECSRVGYAIVKSNVKG
jgi:CheY-like chemotaxis protein